MSLARLALRFAAVRALRGRTMVGENVLDSRIGVIEVGDAGNALTSEKKPFIAVYTAGSEADIGGRSLMENGATWLVFELGVTAAMSVTDPETDESVLLPGIPLTDHSMEMLLDLVSREVMTTLTDPGNAWAELFRNLTTGISRVEVEPLRSGDDGQRLAARQLRLKVDLIDDPVSGEYSADEGPLGPFLAALDALEDPVASSQADLIRTAIGATEAADWRNVQRRRGMTAGEMLALGLGPLANDEDRDTPIFEEAAVEIEGSEPFEVVP